MKHRVERKHRHAERAKGAYESRRYGKRTHTVYPWRWDAKHSTWVYTAKPKKHGYGWESHAMAQYIRDWSAEYRRSMVQEVK